MFTSFKNHFFEISFSQNIKIRIFRTKTNKIWCRSNIKLEKWVKKAQKTIFFKKLMMYPLWPKIENFQFLVIWSNHMFSELSDQADHENVRVQSLRRSVQKLWAFKVSSACIIGYNFWTEGRGKKTCVWKKCVFWIQLVETFQETYSMIDN